MIKFVDTIYNWNFVFKICIKNSSKSYFIVKKICK